MVSNYTETLDLVEAVCNTERLQQLRLDGSTPAGARMPLVERFNAQHCEARVFLLSAKAGGTGLVRCALHTHANTHSRAGAQIQISLARPELDWRQPPAAL